MSVKTLGMRVAGFIRHYGDELLQVTGLLKGVVGSLPIDHDDKASIASVVERLEAAAKAAQAGASAVANAPVVTVKRSDLVAIVNEVAPALIKAEVAKQLAEAKAVEAKSEGN